MMLDVADLIAVLRAEIIRQSDEKSDLWFNVEEDGEMLCVDGILDLRELATAIWLAR